MVSEELQQPALPHDGTGRKTRQVVFRKGNGNSYVDRAGIARRVMVGYSASAGAEQVGRIGSSSTRLSRSCSAVSGAAGIESRICNYTSAGMGITVLIENFVTLEKAKHIANYSSRRMSKLYKRRMPSSASTFDEVL